MIHEKQSTHVVWRAGMTFDATTTTGHHLVLDAPPPNGEDRGPKPIELMLTALGGCTAMDVLSLLQKMREPVIELNVDVEGTRCHKHHATRPRAWPVGGRSCNESPRWEIAGQFHLGGGGRADARRVDSAGRDGVRRR